MSRTLSPSSSSRPYGLSTCVPASGRAYRSLGHGLSPSLLRPKPPRHPAPGVGRCRMRPCWRRSVPSSTASPFKRSYGHRKVVRPDLRVRRPCARPSVACCGSCASTISSPPTSAVGAPEAFAQPRSHHHPRGGGQRCAGTDLSHNHHCVGGAGRGASWPVDHYSAELSVGIHAARRPHRFEEPLSRSSQGVAALAYFERACARGIARRVLTRRRSRVAIHVTTPSSRSSAPWASQTSPA